jgi:hypothetical protein
MLVTKVVPLDTIRSLNDELIIPQGQQIFSIYYASIPAGVTVQHAFGQKFPVPVQDGMSFAFDKCDPQTEGYSLVTFAAFPGQAIVVQFAIGQGGPMNVTGG